MRTKVKTAAPASPEARFMRVLQALEQELLDASDEEIIAAATDLGMNPQMKGSALFAGLKYPARLQLSDFFELGMAARLEAEQTSIVVPDRATPKPTK